MFYILLLFFSSFLIWSDSAVPVERIIELKSFQVKILCLNIILSTSCLLASVVLCVLFGH